LLRYSQIIRMNDKQPSNGEPPRVALRDSIVRKILASIMLGKIEPGTRLVALDLSEQFGVSATPIREAIVELCGLGMVSIRHNRGAYVLEFGRTELAELFHMRHVLECEAARLSCGKVPASKLEELCAQLNSLPPEHDASWVTEVSAFDFGVHCMVREHCDNKRLIWELDRYTVMGETLRAMLDKTPVAMRESLPTIVTVLDAAEKKDLTVMVSAMHEHISILARIAEKLLFDGR
jgi:DNA-binding GntR family transcriptional regulator